MSNPAPKRPKPVLLAILDGWGHRDELADNAIAAAQTPVWDALLEQYPHGLINASELHVGLPGGQMGNSEVGHMNIGSGRVMMQDLPRIDAALADGSLQRKEQFVHFVEKVRAATGTVHLLGLLSDGGVHSHQAHFVAMAKLFSERGLKVVLHLFLDGRDTPPQSALGYVKQLNDGLAGLAEVSTATVAGRYYAMDRDKRWDRVQKAYDTLTAASGDRVATVEEAVQKSYEAGKHDEFIVPVAIGDYEGMDNGDGLFMVNFRSDRVREILTALLDSGFAEFTRGKEIKFSATLGMTEYSAKLVPLIPALFPPEPLTKILGEVVADAGLKQLRIAETEKYAHVTFFFNGGREAEFAGESRILIPSPKVATYDLKPEMSAPEITDKLVEAINAGTFDLIVVNYANTDMVGHTGNVPAAIQAVQAVDTCLGRVQEAVQRQGGAMIITADHGNAEMMFDHETEQAHTAHTLNLVPVVLVAPELRGKQLAIPEGKLADIAPTVLKWLQLPQPKEMTGQSLLQ